MSRVKWAVAGWLAFPATFAAGFVVAMAVDDWLTRRTMRRIMRRIALDPIRDTEMEEES